MLPVWGFIPQPEVNSGAIAQLGERLPCTQEVGGSIPPGSTNSHLPDICQSALYYSSMEEKYRQLVRLLAEGNAIPRDKLFEAQLADFGIEVNVSDEALTLAEPLELIDVDKLAGYISDDAKLDLSQVDVHWSVDSTNVVMMNRSRLEGFAGSVCLAERQTAGKGRRGRHWVSPFGKNIYISLGWHLPVARSVEGLSLVVGLAVARAIEASGGGAVQLKWPNDVLKDRAKVAGILVELGGVQSGQRSVVAGIGVNLNLSEADASSIDQPWQALKVDSRNQLIGQLINHLTRDFKVFAAEGFAPFRAQWMAHDAFKDEQVRVLLGENSIPGRNRGVDEAGNLLVETDQGLQHFNAGEVSLRGDGQ